MKNNIRIYTILSNICIVLIIVSLGFVSFFSNIKYNEVIVDKEGLYYNGNRESNNVTLMFNVYWGTEYIPKILEILKQYNYKTTFFVGGSWADDNNDILKQIKTNGHEIGSHGYFHKDQGKLSYESNLSEIRANNVLIKNILNIEMKLFAPPSGSYNDYTLKAAKDENMKVIMWSKDTIDWRDKDSDLIFNRATKVIGGDFVLMHPTECTVNALERILIYYKNNNFKVVTISENISNFV